MNDEARAVAVLLVIAFALGLVVGMGAMIAVGGL